MLSARIDSWLAALSVIGKVKSSSNALVCRMVDTSVGPVRLFDSAPEDRRKPIVVMVPDGPNVIEHHAELFALLTPQLRVVCFDMPGFGFSHPRPDYSHALDQGAAAVLSVIDALGIAHATLAFSCANGFYGLRLARLHPKRVAGLVLVQTPALATMPAWTKRNVPAVLRVPVLGQLLGWFLRKRAAHGWYEIALARGIDATKYQSKARIALDAGGCFCLAGVVQGLGKAAMKDVVGVEVPCTMIWGDRDHSHKHTDPLSLLKDVPHAEILHFPECGHFSDLEQSARYAEILVSKVIRHHADRQLLT
jgi:pimeloyl-ACP methyl ester carboxylesterase